MHANNNKQYVILILNIDVAISYTIHVDTGYGVK